MCDTRTRACALDTQAGSPHDGHAPPSMLLGYLNITMIFFFGAFALAGRVTGLATKDGFVWARLAWPPDGTDWALIAVHCAFVLSAQLALAAGYR
jgi:hypothetical protein